VLTSPCRDHDADAIPPLLATGCRLTGKRVVRRLVAVRCEVELAEREWSPEAACVTAGRPLDAGRPSAVFSFGGS